MNVACSDHRSLLACCNRRSISKLNKSAKFSHPGTLVAITDTDDVRGDATAGGSGRKCASAGMPLMWVIPEGMRHLWAAPSQYGSIFFDLALVLFAVMKICCRPRSFVERLWKSVPVELALGESQYDPAGFHMIHMIHMIHLDPTIHLETSLSEDADSVMISQSHNKNLPLITIFAESGPLAGDLAACLSGRFDIIQVTNIADALKSLSQGCKAMLLLRGAQEEFGPVRVDLVRQAIRDHCRVLVLGSGGLGLEPELDREVVHLPPLPSPQILFESLVDLEPGLQAESS